MGLKRPSARSATSKGRTEPATRRRVSLRESPQITEAGMPSPQRVVLLPAALLLALAGQGPAPTKPLVFTTVAAGGNHSCAITTDSLAYCWGANESGQLGTGSVTSHQIGRAHV